MKALRIAVAAGIAASLLVTAAHAAGANAYNSKAALVGRNAQATTPVTVAVATHELSARYALLSGHSVTPTEPQPVQLASYNTKTAVRGIQPASIELAPLK